MSVDRAEWSIAGTTTLDREWFTIICQNLIIQHNVNINKDENKSLISNKLS
jgi:hypothetical protein